MAPQTDKTTPKYTLGMRFSNLAYDLHRKTDLFRKRFRCRQFLYYAFGDDPENGMVPEHVATYIEEAEWGDDPFKVFFNVPWLPWAIDWKALARDYNLWLHSHLEWEEQEREAATLEAEQYYAMTGERL